MSVEIEAKLKVESLEPVRERLVAADAEFLRAVTERNLHFDSADGRLRAADSVLRIRSVVVHRGAEATSTLTYKGARLPGKVKRRTEIELDIADAPTAGRLLEALGFTLVSEIEKRRETWRLGSCHVELDEVPYLGTFVEIEGPDEKAIAVVQEALGLAHVSHIQEGYVALLLDHCRRNHLPIRHIAFA